MITKLQLTQFKSFQQAELSIDDFTLLVGTNASGKSNLCDAFRFLHGIGCGYTLAEIIGGVYRNGVEIWSGIRGGTRSLAFNRAKGFALGVAMTICYEQTTQDVWYEIHVALGNHGEAPKIFQESLQVIGEEKAIFTLGPSDDFVYFVSDHQPILSREYVNSCNIQTGFLYSDHQPILSQFNRYSVSAHGHIVAQGCLDVLREMRFLDFNPDVMRQPSLPGQKVLSDRGENLSAVLHTLCADAQQKATLMSWLENLTPMDVADLTFQVDATGKVILTLVEQDGRETLALNASDGTLRFLAFLTALLSHDTRQCYIFEEIEHGIHPTRLYLLLELIQRQSAQKACQVIATKHSPQVLLMVRPTYLDAISLTYRLPEKHDTRIIRVVDLPDARRLIESQDIGRLHETGWFEDAADFVADREAEA